MQDKNNGKATTDNNEKQQKKNKKAANNKRKPTREDTKLNGIDNVQLRSALTSDDMELEAIEIVVNVS